jgi:curved DNA-binding protein CbpA
VETAYRVLSDAETRKSYDVSLGGAGPAPAEGFDYAPELGLEPIRAPNEPFDDLDEAGEYDGARLRRARLRRGIDLDEIALRTKVNSGYLASLEEERFSKLPPRVYVRGFVMAFAGCLGLDPVAVAASYMHRYDAERPRQRRRFTRGT